MVHSAINHQHPPTVRPFQTVEYPFPFEQVHTEEAGLFEINIGDPRAILAPLLEGRLIFGSICWHFMRPRFLLVLAVNRVEDVNASKTFRPLDDERTHVWTVDYDLGNLAVGRYRELAVLRG